MACGGPPKPKTASSTPFPPAIFAKNRRRLLVDFGSMKGLRHRAPSRRRPLARQHADCTPPAVFPCMNVSAAMSIREGLRHARAIRQQLQELRAGRATPNMLPAMKALHTWTGSRRDTAETARQPLSPELHRFASAFWLVFQRIVAGILLQQVGCPVLHQTAGLRIPDYSPTLPPLCSPTLIAVSCRS